MAHKCAACGCSCGYDKYDTGKDVTSLQSPLRTQNFCLERSPLLQCSALPLSAALVTSTLGTDADSERTNELSEANPATNVIQGCTLDLIQSRLNMETLPDGFVCNKMSDKILLYKLEISCGLIAIECGIVLTSDFQVTCNRYNEVLPVNIYEDLLFQGKQIRSISQLKNLMRRLNGMPTRQGQPDLNRGTPCSLAAQNFNFEENSVLQNIKQEELSEQSDSSLNNSNEELSDSEEFADLLQHCYSKSESDVTMQSADGDRETVEDVVDIRTTAYAHEPETLENNKCSTCKKVFSSKISLNQHITRMHGENNYECENSSHYSLKSYICAVQLKGKPYKCLQCGACFSQEDDLNQHVVSVHCRDKPSDCSACDKKFFRCYPHDDHWRSVHSRKKPYSCDQCDYKCSRKEYLTGQQGHDGMKNSIRSDLRLHCVAVQYQLKPYSCTECDRAFNVEANLKSHIDAVHRGLKPFPCTECDRRFSRKADLQIHINAVHRKEKPYSCPVCSKSFSKMQHARSHVENIHTNHKPHQCQQCSMNFSQKSLLNTHMKAVHK